MELLQYGAYYSHIYNNELDLIWDIIMKACCNDNKEGMLLKRSSCIVESWNESLMQQVLEYSNSNDNGNSILLKNIEENRKEACKSIPLIAPLEDSIQEHLQNEHLLQHEEDDDWWWVSPNTNSNIGMGMGSITLAQSYINYSKTIEKNVSNPIIQYILIKQVYERGIVECPTIEVLWIQYVYYLQKYQSLQDNNNSSMHSVIERSIKNCPYSVKLFSIQLQNTWESNYNDNDDDDDWITSSYLNIVEQARILKFLPNVESYVQLYLEMCRIPTRYFQQYNYNITSSSSNILKLKQSINQIRKLYDASINILLSDIFVTKQYLSIVYYNRAYFEAYVITPLEDNNNNEIKSNAIPFFEKCTQHNILNISYWKEYIIYQKCIMEEDVFVIRKLYQRAITSIINSSLHNNNKRNNNTTTTNDDNIDLKSFGIFYQEYKTFEYHFGTNAQDMLQDVNKFDKKYNGFVYKYNQLLQEQQLQQYQQKRKYNQDNHTSNKKVKIDDNDNDAVMKSSPDKKKLNDDQEMKSSSPSTKTTNLSKKKKNKEKEYITINHLKYPIHPYTIQVSNLPLSIKHNDLLKMFESFDFDTTDNATILHARMLHHKPKRNIKPITFKKALIQFYTTSILSVSGPPESCSNEH